MINLEAFESWSVSDHLFSPLTLSFCLSLCGGKAAVFCEFVRKEQSQLRLNIGLLTLNCLISVACACDSRRQFTAYSFKDVHMYCQNCALCL